VSQPPVASRWLVGTRVRGDARRVITSTGYQAAGRLISVAAALATVVAMSRYLGPAGYGEYAYVVAFVGFFAPLIWMGLDTIVIRELAKPGGDDARLMAVVMSLKLVLATVAAAVAAAWALLVEADARRVLLLIAVPTLWAAALSARGLVFQARLDMAPRLIADTLPAVLLCAATLALVSVGGSVTGFVVAFSAATIVGAVVLVWLSRRALPLALSPDVGAWRTLLATAAPLGLAGVFYQVYYRVDILILEHLRGAASVGVYALAYGLVDQSRAFFALLAMSLFPVMVRRRSEQGGFPTVMGLGVVLGIGTGLIAIAVVWLAGSWLVALLYGAAYAGTADALAVLSISLPMGFANFVLSYAVATLEKQHLSWRITLLAALANIVLNLALVPTLDYLGSSYATVATEAVVFVLMGTLVARSLAGERRAAQSRPMG
jgi:O-antigen/teichoic acid export membrane protein